MMASRGFTTRLWISVAEAPGLATMMLAAGTTICGLYSRGVTTRASRPVRVTARMNRAVSLEVRKPLASLPARFMADSAWVSLMAYPTYL